MHRISNAVRILGTTFLLGPVACGSDPAAGTPTPSTTTPMFAPAPASAQRLQITLDSFDVAPGGEVYKCQTFQNPLGYDVAILQSQSMMSKGSHHLAVFRVDQNANAPLEDCSGLEFHATIHAAQTPTALTLYPPGVGAFLSGTEGIRLNAHYLNLTEKTVTAHVSVALDYVAPDQVQYTAAQVYLNDSTLNIPPGTGTGGGTIRIPALVTGAKLISAQSHMHRHALDFTASLDDGTTLYTSDTWEEPPVKTFTPGIPLADGAKISWKCNYNNDTSATLVFGESANTTEMCVFTGFYYPAPDGQMIVGDLGLGATASLLK